MQTYLEADGLLIPDSIVAEQSSSDLTARFAASLVPQGGTVADLTAGLGVNSWWLAQRSKTVYAVEREPSRAEALRFNFELTGVRNIEVICDDCIHWLETSTDRFDTTFVDPSRRDEKGRRLVSLKECSPNVTELLQLLKGRTNRLIVKASPLLDITSVLREVPGVEGIYIVEVKREVRELLIVVDTSGSPSSATTSKEGETEDRSFVRYVNLPPDGEPFILELPVSEGFHFPPVEMQDVRPGGYLYEPAPGVMKSGRFEVLHNKWPDLRKLDPNSHLFYSESLHTDFPGRAFSIKREVSSSDLKKLKGSAFNVISRNHPAKAPEIENRFKFKGSECNFIIATKILGKKYIFSAKKVV